MFSEYDAWYSDYFDCPYYHSYTMDAYQNLISGDKPPREGRAVVSGGCCPNKSIIQKTMSKIKIYCILEIKCYNYHRKKVNT